MRQELSRTPRRYTENGVRIYCSPRCGCKCLEERYDAAVKLAKAAQKKLGRGWSTEVWENMGWHWAVHHAESGTAIHQHGPANFWINLTVKGAGQHHLTAKSLTKARDAIVEQLRTASENLLHAAYLMDVDKRTTGKGK